MQVNETLQHGQLGLLCRTQLLHHLRPADRRVHLLTLHVAYNMGTKAKLIGLQVHWEFA